MNPVTVDEQKRIRTPDAVPGQVFDGQRAGKDAFTLTLINPVPAGPVKSELIVKNGYTVIRTGVPIDYEVLQAALKEFRELFAGCKHNCFGNFGGPQTQRADCQMAVRHFVHRHKACGG